MSFIHNNYFLSEKIKVFPCAYRNSTYDATSRLNTEYNFTHLPHTVDKASYIIKFNDKSKSEPKAELICVIQGYYFEIELDTGDYNTLQNKYLNICVASPSITSTPGTNFIEGPHLCSWYEFSDSIEDALDIEQVGGAVFTGIKISESSSLSKEGYQCYALKLDDSAKLPIMANKIENSAGTGKPISQEFTTDTLTANKSISTTSLNAKSLNVENDSSPILRAYSNEITAYRTVKINSSLTSTSLYVQQASSTPILKAWSEKVTIHKPTYIEGANSNLTVAGTGKFGDKLTVSSGGADITGDTQIKKSSSGATNGNLIVAGRGSFGGELSVTADIDTGTAFTIGKVQQQDSKQQDLGKLLCADAEVPLFVKNNLYVRGRNIDIGNTSSVPNITIYGIQPKSNDTSTFANGELLKIDQVTGKIAVYGLRKAASKDETDTVGEIFSIDPKTGITYAKKINAEVEGISANAVNVTTSIAGTPITNIFDSTDSTIDKLKLKTINPGKAISGRDPIKIVVDNNPTKAVEFYRDENNFTIVKADKFEGNATTATAFKETAIIQLTGAVTSNPILSTHGWTIPTTLENNAVTTTKIRDNNVTNAKLENSSITIGYKLNTTTSPSIVELGGSIGTSANPFIGGLYFGDSKDSAKDCKLIINSQYIKNKMEFPLEIRSGNSYLIKFTNNYGAKDNTSVPKQIIYAATGSDHKGRTELFGDKICIYAQGHDYISGTIEAGTVDLSASSSNAGLKIDNIGQIKVKGASAQYAGLKSSDTIQVVGSTVRLLDSSLVVASGMITIGDQLRFNTSSGNIETNGTVEAASFNATSDRRLKENIIDYKPEKSILDLPVKKFDFIDGPKNQIGCIAQDLKEICPEIVNENEKGYLSIQESKLVYLLLDEVKKLKKELDEIKNR